MGAVMGPLSLVLTILFSAICLGAFIRWVFIVLSNYIEKRYGNDKPFTPYKFDHDRWD